MLDNSRPWLQCEISDSAKPSNGSNCWKAETFSLALVINVYRAEPVPGAAAAAAEVLIGLETRGACQ